MKIKIDQEELNQVDSLPFFNEVFSSLKNWINTIDFFTQLNVDFASFFLEARRFRSFSDVIILGTGGSSLSGKMYSTFKKHAAPKMHFMENVEGTSWNNLLNEINMEKTGVIAISKSGETTETIAQLLLALDAWSDFQHSKHFLCITESNLLESNSMHEIINYYNLPTFDHPKGIGGRFSCFSVVGLLPALIVGLDVKSIIDGASETLKYFLNENDLLKNSILVGAKKQYDLFQEGVNISVFFAYSNSLLNFCNWWRQLWAESLGKKNVNEDEEEEDFSEKLMGQSSIRFFSTPTYSIGTVDQHSQLQLYLDGPRDKFFTFLTVLNHDQTEKIKSSFFRSPILQALNGHEMSDLFLAHQKVTIQSLTDAHVPLRNIILENLDEENLGAIMMYMILETLAVSIMAEINPFNQPAVASGKDKVLNLLKT